MRLAIYKSTLKTSIMKHLFALLVLLLFSAATPANGKSRSVRVQTPGTLPTLIGERQKNKLTHLTIEGAINGTDLRFLREMAGNDAQQLPTNGRLISLDLSHATFAPGGEAYIYKDEWQRVKGGTLTLPDYAFRNCRLETIVLPERMDTIGIGAFEISALRSIRIPEESVVTGWAFNRCEQLTQVEFPQYLVELGQDNFRDCSRLRTIRIHDIEYLPFHAFENVGGLEEIIIDGTLWHADGWFVNACPNLRRIEFSGLVVTTGGEPIASRCPQLADITFSGVCFPMFFGSVEDCPLMKQCNVTGYVMQSQNEEFIPYRQSIHNLSTQRLQELQQKLRQYFDNPSIASRFAQFNNYTNGHFAYNTACIFALKDQPQEALRYLEIAANYGYEQYKHAQKDTDLQCLHGNADFERLIRQMEENWKTEHDYLNILRTAPAYAAAPSSNAPTFTYAPPSDPNLQRVRSFFRLDSIAGNGDEITRMKRIMYWLHDEIPHDGSGGIPDAPHNAIDLYQACKAQERGLNCRGLALVLSELYLAMGWPSRALTCQPKKYKTDPDCHVINMVWSRDLKKWVWMDPSFAAFVTDEDGLLLHPGEVRQRLIDGRPLVLNEDANWNHRTQQTKEHYLEMYMAKNLYYLSAYLHNGFGIDQPGSSRENYYSLAPEGSEPPYRPAPSDEQWFWQPPSE